MARLEITATLTGDYHYTAPAYGYGYETRYIYTFLGEDGKTYVWKTTTFMVLEYEDAKGWITKANGKTYNTAKINKGDVIRMKATVKGESEYNGQPQTEINRVTVLERIFRAKTSEEIAAEREAERKARKQEQLDGITAGDIIWRMPYKQYKDHYSDCETLIDSFESRDMTKDGVATIAVIIREGRLKNSGVRGKHYSGYRFTFTHNGEQESAVFRAISEETALRRLKEDFKGAEEIKLDHIYRYWMS